MKAKSAVYLAGATLIFAALAQAASIPEAPPDRIVFRATKDPKLALYAKPGLRSPPEDPRNLEGVWGNSSFDTTPVMTVFGELPPYTAAAQNTVLHRVHMARVGTPVAEPGVLCRPPGLTRDMNEGFPFEIVQGKDKMVFLSEEGHSVRVVWMNQAHPKVLEPTYMGHSVGHWEGNTLVVDSIGFNGKTWLDFAGSPHGEKLHVVERIRRVNLGGAYVDLQDLITIDDPEHYARPWTYLKTYRWRPDEIIGEYNCEESSRAENLEGVQIEDPSLVGK